MARSADVWLLVVLVVGVTITTAAQSSVPPLQWLNLTPLLTGTASPPPLKDAVLGYDEDSRTLVIFGGESQGGFPQDNTYLLDLKALSWVPLVSPSSLQTKPPPRSAAISGCDFAASNRHGFVVIGGKGANSEPLSDVWEFDFTNHFWSQVQLSPGGPSARWGAAGGIDSRTSTIQDPILPGPNNTFYLSGGFNGKSSIPISDLWRLNISGTLSSNLPNAVSGSWDQVHLSTLPPLFQSGNTVVGQKIVVVDGCSDLDICEQQSSFVVDAASKQQISPAACPVPRTDPVVVPNMNTASPGFGSQVFLLLGTFNNTVWDDQNGLNSGEVDVLDIGAGTWSRILPSGDPGSTGKQSFPSPRRGSAAFSAPLSLAGASRTNAADTIVFGGQDISGNYLSEVWLLRAYDDVLTPDNPTFTGAGTGKLQTGANANGVGVAVKYLTTCAKQNVLIDPSPPTSSSGSNTQPTETPISTTTIFQFNTSTSHKVLSTVSLILLFPAILIHRFSSPLYNGTPTRFSTSGPCLHIPLFLVAFGIGIAGLAMSFTTISPTTSFLNKRQTSSKIILRTSHGQSALALFVALFGLGPIIILFALVSIQLRQTPTASNMSDVSRERTNSIDTAEKLNGAAKSPSHSLAYASRPSSPRRRTASWGPSSLFRPSHEGRPSSDSESNISSAPQRTFEVLNRPPRNQPGRLEVPSGRDKPPLTTRSLSDIDWLQRRRSLNAVGELDYVITQTIRAQEAIWSPTDSQPRPSSTPLMIPKTPLPRVTEIIIRLLLHLFLCGLCIITLIALWTRTPPVFFALFLVCVVAFYIIILSSAWYGHPSKSILAILSSRLRGEGHSISHRPSPPSPSSPSPRPMESQEPFPTGPYLHQPPHRPQTLNDVESPLASPADDEDESEDEESRQRRIEDEMGRRDVSIVTVPKRRLWITNPS